MSQPRGMCEEQTAWDILATNAVFQLEKAQKAAGRPRPFHTSLRIALFMFSCALGSVNQAEKCKLGYKPLLTVHRLEYKETHSKPEALGPPLPDLQISVVIAI